MEELHKFRVIEPVYVDEGWTETSIQVDDLGDGLSLHSVHSRGVKNCRFVLFYESKPESACGISMNFAECVEYHVQNMSYSKHYRTWCIHENDPSKTSTLAEAIEVAKRILTCS